jgi:cytochrome c oxidase subunit 5b
MIGILNGHFLIGFPVESHDVIWINLDKSHEHDRCPECGSVFAMDFVGSEEEHHH